MGKTWWRTKHRIVCVTEQKHLSKHFHFIPFSLIDWQSRSTAENKTSKHKIGCLCSCHCEIRPHSQGTAHLEWNVTSSFTKFIKHNALIMQTSWPKVVLIENSSLVQSDVQSFLLATATRVIVPNSVNSVLIVYKEFYE